MDLLGFGEHSKVLLVVLFESLLEEDLNLLVVAQDEDWLLLHYYI